MLRIFFVIQIFVLVFSLILSVIVKIKGNSIANRVMSCIYLMIFTGIITVFTSSYKIVGGLPTVVQPGVDHTAVDKLNKDVNSNIPQKMKDVVLSNGYKVVLLKDEKLMNSIWYKSDTASCSGFKVVGSCESDALVNRIFLAMIGDYRFNYLHEFGHAYDRSMDELSHTEEFERLYELESDNLAIIDPYVKQGIEEYFASSMAWYISHDHLRLDEDYEDWHIQVDDTVLGYFAPETYKYMQELCESNDENRHYRCFILDMKDGLKEKCCKFAVDNYLE